MRVTMHETSIHELPAVWAGTHDVTVHSTNFFQAQVIELNCCMPEWQRQAWPWQ